MRKYASSGTGEVKHAGPSMLRSAHLCVIIGHVSCSLCDIWCGANYSIRTGRCVCTHLWGGRLEKIRSDPMGKGVGTHLALKAVREPEIFSDAVYQAKHRCEVRSCVRIWIRRDAHFIVR